jgi:hypothetical protein
MSIKKVLAFVVSSFLIVLVGMAILNRLAGYSSIVRQFLGMSA